MWQLSYKKELMYHYFVHVSVDFDLVHLMLLVPEPYKLALIKRVLIWTSTVAQHSFVTNLTTSSILARSLLTSFCCFHRLLPKWR